MTTLDMLGPAIWRASWQAAALALVVAFLARCLGERLAPRWRFWLWGVVVARLLLVITPASPWSAFNLAPHTRQASARITEPFSHGEPPRLRLAQQAAEDRELDQQALVLAERCRGAERAGKRSVARIYCQQAAKRASGSSRTSSLRKIAEFQQP